MAGRITTERTSLRRITDAIFSVQLAIAVGMIASARFAWLFSHSEKDSPRPGLALFLYELPLISCLLPFVTGDMAKRTVRSAGMIFGTTLGFCPVLLILTAGAILTFAGAPVELARFYIRCFVVVLWMLGVSWWRGKEDRPAFIASAKRGFLCFLIVSLLVVLASL